MVIAPLINSSFYPAFVEYPGSISLRAATARDTLIETCDSLASFGPDLFYVLNTGLSTENPLAEAAELLAHRGVSLHYLRLQCVHERLPEGLFRQTFGSHADERETSLMLHIAPEVVDMDRAVADGAEGEGRLTRTEGNGTWSPSGVYGDATLATREKGERLASAMVETACHDIEQMFDVP